MSQLNWFNPRRDGARRPRPQSLRDKLLRMVETETDRQDQMWPWPRPASFLRNFEAAHIADLASELERISRDLLERHPTWHAILGEEVGEAMCETDPGRRVVELVQVAAVAVSWAQAILESQPSSPDPTPSTSETTQLSSTTASNPPAGIGAGRSVRARDGYLPAAGAPLGSAPAAPFSGLPSGPENTNDVITREMRESLSAMKRELGHPSSPSNSPGETDATSAPNRSLRSVLGLARRPFSGAK